jgi:tetratricopeptide (TPR) repeat protein
MKSIALMLIAALALAAVPAHAFDAAEVVAAKKAVQDGMNAGDAAALVAARGKFAALSAAEPSSALLHYWVGMASWRTLPMVQRKDKDEARRIGLDGVAHLDRAIEIDPKFAEAYAMKGGLQGMLIGVGGGSPMTLGPQSDQNLARAEVLAPGNPRVALLDGVGILHKPAIFGGGAKKAIARLAEAQAMFAKETVSDPTLPDWGRDDVHTWMGRAYAEQKKWNEAVASYKRALEANPDNGWVKNVLLPEAEKKSQQAAK